MLSRRITFVVATVSLLLINIAYWQTNPFGRNEKKTLETQQEIEIPGIVLGEQIDQSRQQTIVAGEELLQLFPSSHIRGGIVPHDELHTEYIDHFFRELSGQHPEKIILIGPNHFEVGIANVQTADVFWKTPFGTVTPAAHDIAVLLDEFVAKNEVDNIRAEHSLGVPMPFIAKHIPEAKITPIMLKAATNREELRALRETLLQMIDETTVVVAAVDFSHYLTAEEAARNDRVTRHALEGLHYDSILALNDNFNDFLDSPASIALLMMLMESLGATSVDILYNTNSGLLAGLDTVPVTSYFEAVYY